MPIQQTKKQSDLEKRLRLLRQQVYGRSEEKKWEMGSGNQDIPLRAAGIASGDARQYHTSHPSTSLGTGLTPPTSNPQPLQSDITYLRHDLLKITSFATVAFGIQIILYFLLRNNIARLNFL